MSENVESLNQNPQSPADLTIPPETQPSPPPPSAAAKSSTTVSFSIWPPSERTRDAVKNRLIETLSSPSILSKRYGTVSREEALESANRIEEEAYDAAGKAAAENADDDGIEILQVYSKEISKRMLETVKARSGGGENVTVKADDEDAGSNAPPQSEKTESVAGDE